MKYDKIFSEQQKQQIIKDYVVNHLSYKEIMLKYNIRSSSYMTKLLKANARSAGEANKIARKKFPESFKHSEETKQKIREIRLKYMKEHPENTAWRQKNLSYPEQQFIKFLKQYKYSDKFQIIREYSVFPYFIDFAFIDIKLAIEIDGSQHLQKERQAQDKRKEDLLISQGWTVLRFSENLVKTDWNLINTTLLKYTTSKNVPIVEKVGIFKGSKKYQKKTRGIDGKTDAQRNAIEQIWKKSKCPSKEILLELIKIKSLLQISKDFKVSDNTIRRWCKRYDILDFRKNQK